MTRRDCPRCEGFFRPGRDSSGRPELGPTVETVGFFRVSLRDKNQGVTSRATTLEAFGLKVDDLLQQSQRRFQRGLRDRVAAGELDELHDRSLLLQ